MKSFEEFKEAIENRKIKLEYETISQEWKNIINSSYSSTFSTLTTEDLMEILNTEVDKTNKVTYYKIKRGKIPRKLKKKMKRKEELL